MRPVTTGLVLAVVAVLALTAPAAALGAVDGAQAGPGLLAPAENETVDRHAHGATADLGTAAAATDATLRVELEHRTLAASLETTDDRTALVAAYLERLEAEAAALVERDRAALAAALDGDLTERELVREVTRTGVQAAARQGTLDGLAGLDGTVPALDLGAAATRLDHRYDLTAGPVRDRILDAAVAPDRRTTVTIGLAPDYLALAGVDGDRYRHEAVRYDRLGVAGTAVENLSAAESIVVEAYPSTTATTAARDLGGDLFIVERALVGGAVTAFVDAGTAAVAAERQHRWLDTVSLDEAGSETELGTQLRLDRSFDGGPLRVSVTDVATGDAAEGTVYLRHAGTWTALGAVSADGTVWAGDPGGPVDVRVVTPDGTITLSVDV